MIFFLDLLIIEGNRMTFSKRTGKIPGVRFREHKTRKINNGMQKDKYYFIYFQLNNKRKEEGVGWASEGWTEKESELCFFKSKKTSG